jgi:cytochrome c
MADQPARFADGTKMTFAGLDSAEDRANVMVYLNQQGRMCPCRGACHGGQGGSGRGWDAASST